MVEESTMHTKKLHKFLFLVTLVFCYFSCKWEHFGMRHHLNTIYFSGYPFSNYLIVILFINFYYKLTVYSDLKFMGHKNTIGIIKSS